MLNAIYPQSAGNALILTITPPSGAVSWRVLRRTDAAAFTGPDDAGAVTVADGSRDNQVLDDTRLVNGVTYAYRVYYRDNSGAWIGHDDGQGTPQASYRGDDLDPLSLLRDRLEAGFAVEVSRGALRPKSGKIPVLTAPFALVDGATFPCVSVHLDSDSPSAFALGDVFSPDEHIAGIGWDETTGWLSSTSLNVIAVSLNGDERIAMRRALRRIVQANLPIFYGHGLRNIEFRLQDTEEPNAQNAPLFMSAGSFSCIAPAYVTGAVPEIRDVAVSATTPENLNV